MKLSCAVLSHVVLIGKEAHKQNLYDLNDTDGIQAYIAACLAASKVPQLTDRSRYNNMLAASADKFGSKKQIKKRNAALKA